MTPQHDGRALVLGSGPTACAAAVTLARRGFVVTLAARQRSQEQGGRVDALPVQILGSLIELGIHPAVLGVSATYGTMLRAWDDSEPTLVSTPPKVHVDRQVLDEVLTALAFSTAGVTVDPDARTEAFRTVFDATGRRARTAASVHRATPEWVARVRTFEGRLSPAQGAFRIAALPYGYAYRLGTPDRLCLGLVSPLDVADRFEGEWWAELARWGAGWLVGGLPRNEAGAPGRGGASSVQWAVAGGTRLIGDACFAPDILAAQGLSLGLTAGLAVASPGGSRSEGIATHITALRQSLRQCRWRGAVAWKGYDKCLAQLADLQKAEQISTPDQRRKL